MYTGFKKTTIQYVLLWIVQNLFCVNPKELATEQCDMEKNINLLLFVPVLIYKIYRYLLYIYRFRCYFCAVRMTKWIVWCFQIYFIGKLYLMDSSSFLRKTLMCIPIRMNKFGNQFLELINSIYIIIQMYNTQYSILILLLFML